MSQEDEFWSQQEFLFDLLQRLPAHVFWKDVNGIYKGCNQAFVKSVGLHSIDEVIGKNDFDFKTKTKETLSFLADDQTVIDTRKWLLNIEEEQTIPGRGLAILLTNKVPLVSKSNKVMGVLGYHIDITERKNMETALKVPKLKAEAANRAKIEFLANMSHDIRTPLSGIIGLSEMLVNKITDEEILTSLKAILLSGVKLLEFFDNCLVLCNANEADDLSKNEAFNLPSLIEHITQLFASSLHGKKIKLQISYEAGLPQEWCGNHVYIYRILQNIIGNAIKFTHKGSIQVRVARAAPQTREQQQTLAIEVKDTGIGIPNDKFEVIFDRFTRLNPSYEGVYNGAGVGLSLVKEYVEALKGKIKVTSIENEGSQFIIYLPLTAV